MNDFLIKGNTDIAKEVESPSSLENEPDENVS